MFIRIIAIVALVGGIGLAMFIAPYIAQSLSSSDEQILQKTNSRQEVRAFQERFGPVTPIIERHGSAIYVSYAANRTFYYDYPYDDIEKPVQVARILQLTVIFDGWITRVSMECYGDIQPEQLPADTLTIRETDCLQRNLPANSSK